MRSVWRVAFALLGACALAVHAAPVDQSANGEHREARRWRPVAGRLSALEHTPWLGPATPAVITIGAAMDLARAVDSAADLEEALSGERGAALLHLQRNDLDAAIRSLERAAALTPTPDPDLLSDLAALYLERSAQAEHAFDAVKALDTLVQLPVERPTVAFNLALALERFGLRAAAVRAWRDVERLEPGSAWGAEAASRALAVDEPPFEVAWAAWRNQVRAGGPVAAADADRWAERLPGEFFDMVLYDLLGDWGRLCATAPVKSVACGRQLDMAKSMAQRLSASGGGPALMRAVHDLQRADTPRRQALGTGYRCLADGWRASERLEIEAASQSLGKAVESLRRGRSGLVVWAEYWLAATDLHRGRYEALNRRLRALAARNGDPRLRGSIARTTGTAAARQRSLPLAERSYREAHRQFSLAGDAVSAAVVSGYLAEAFLAQGRADEQWALGLSSLATLAEWPTGAYWSYALNNAARATIWQGRPAAGAVIAEENTKLLVGETADAVEVAEAWLLLGHAQLAAGRPDAAGAALRSAEAAVTSIPDPNLRERLAADLALVAGLVATEPARVVQSLSGALETYRQRGLRSFLVPAYASRARAYLELGRIAEAEHDLAAGIEEHERALAEFSDSLSAAPLSEVGQSLYDLLVRLELDGKRDPWAAFLAGDRGKNAAVSLLPGGPVVLTTVPVSLEEMQRALRPGDALLAFTQLEDRLLVTLVKRSTVSYRVIEVARDELTDHARRLLSQLAARGDEQDFRTESTWLFGRLLSPLHAEMEGVEHLIAVPDRGLNLVPFAALLDPVTDRVLIEDRTMSIVPSVRHWLALSRASARVRPRKAWRLGMVSTAGLSQQDGALPGLPGAEREVQEVAKLYDLPSGRLLVGRRATAANFLALLPRVDVLHFAGHSRGEPDAPWRARLWLAAPSPAAELAPLLALEVMREPLEALQLVVLSGCETGLPSTRRTIGSDGLAAAFLAGGARAVVASLWNVEDATSARLMGAFHRRLASGDDAAAALRGAQLDFLHSDERALRHPAQWAFCQLTGLPVRRPGYPGRLHDEF